MGTRVEAQSGALQLGKIVNLVKAQLSVKLREK